GTCYLNGQGVLMDKVQAYKWLTLADQSEDSKSSSKDGKEWLESQIAELEGTMSQPQIALAKKFIRDFLAEKKLPNEANGAGQIDGASPKASGSGFFISDDGVFITNLHVVDGASRMIVKTKRGSFPGELLKFDSANDIALIKVAGS